MLRARTVSRVCFGTRGMTKRELEDLRDLLIVYANVLEEQGRQSKADQMQGAFHTVKGDLRRKTA